MRDVTPTTGPGAWPGPGRPDAWPGQPDRGGDSLPDVLARRLFEARVVLLHGPLDDLAATRLSAEMMTLDADGDDPVSLRIDCPGAPLGPSLTLMDVIELLGVPVHALCLGQVAEGAIGLVAVCAERVALPSTRFALREPPGRLDAHVRDVERWAELHGSERRRFCERVAAAAGRPADVVQDDVERGLYLGAEEAMAYGLIDEVGHADSVIRTLRPPGSAPPPMGFRPAP
jgi:ATP-dependent Clp protease, protease subunit